MKTCTPLPALLLATATLLLLPAPRAEADTIRYSWQRVPNAAYYLGRIERDGYWSYFRTTETWLMFDEGNSLTLDAVDARGRVLKAVTPTMARQPAPQSAEAAKAPPSAGRPEAPPASAPTPAPGTPLWLDLANEPEPPIEAEPPERPAPEEPRPMEEAEELQEPQAPQPPTAAPTPAVVLKAPAALHLSLNLAIGKEWLTAQGGISAYSGTTNIGGTILCADWNPEDSPWYVAGEAGAHDFATSTEVNATGGAGTATTTQTNFLRADVRLGAYYDLGAGSGTYRFGLGAGLAYIRIPLLTTVDQSTGASALAEESALGPFLGLTYELYATDLQTLGIQVDDMPLAFTKAPRAAEEGASVYWRYAFVKYLYTELGVAAERVTAKLGVLCPVDSGCSATSSVRADLVQARMGIGAKF